MKIAIGSDHAGFELKGQMAVEARNAGHDVVDVGAYDDRPSDYPDIAEKVAAAVLSGEVVRGVLICGSGVGASVAANKIPGIRAGLCTDTYSGHQGVEHDDTNVLVLASRITGIEVAREILHSFLAASFSGEERHVRRLGKVKAIEAKYMRS